jgi:ribonuclease Z
MKPLEVIILGSASAIPCIERFHQAILLRYEGEYLLFDCGEGAQIRMQQLKISPLKIKKIFITHWHADHFAGLLPLIETMHLLDRKDKLEIYAPHASFFVETLLELSYFSFGFKIKAIDVGIERKEKIVDEKEYEVYSIPVKHSIPAVGYVFKEKDKWSIDVSITDRLGIKREELGKLKEKGYIEVGGRTVTLEQVARKKEGRKVVISGDTSIVEEVFKEAENSVLIHDATFIEPRKDREHASFYEIAEMCRKYKPKILILTHFSRRYYDSDELEKVKDEVFRGAEFQVLIARDLMKIRIK